MAHTVQYKPNSLLGATGSDTDRNPSPALWADVPVKNIIETGHPYLYEDFTGGSTDQLYKFQTVEGDVGAAFAPTTDEVGGVLSMTTAATDDNEIYMGIPALITFTSGKPFGWEARLKTNIITSGSIIAGLISNAEIAADLLADTHTDAAILDTSAPSFLGFLCAAATDVDALDAIYMDTATVGAHLVHQDVAHTLVADTYVKVGVNYRGGDYVDYFVNGVKVAAGPLDTSTAEVPYGDSLGFVIGAKASAAAAKIIELDWVRFAGYC